MRRLAVILALAALAGCNLVLSEQPWFSAADSAGAPALRDGLWVRIEEPGCAFDERRPAERWPACAAPVVVRGSEMLELQWNWFGTGRRTRREFAGWQPNAIVLAAGDPLIIQSQVEGERPDQFVYTYSGIKPAALDSAGRITAMVVWPVQCGPLAAEFTPAPSGNLEQEHVTNQPFPELTLVDNHCTAADPAALRGAARLSQQLPPALSQPVKPMHWVREGWH